MKHISFILMLLMLTIGISANLVWDSDIAIRTGVNIEWFRTGTETNDGGAIYVWSDTKTGGRDLYAQKVDAQGNLPWGDPLVVDDKFDRQEDPVITKTSDGNFIIAWIEYSFDQDGDVYAQKINTNGQLLWQQGGVPVCTLVGNQISLNIEPDGAGGAYIVWEDARNPSKDLYGQRIDNNGNPVWTLDGNPIGNGPGNEGQNTMWADGEGGLIIAYMNTVSNLSDIYVKRFLPNGTMAWPQMLDLTEVISPKSKIRMAPLTNGEFAFAWEDARYDNPDIFLQKINLAGQKLWPADFRVYADTQVTQQESPRILGTSDNCAIVVWEDRRLDPQNPDLYAQKISSSGTLLWNAAGIQLAVEEFAQDNARMASDGAGGAFIVWEDARNDNVPNIDVYAQHLSSTGTAMWTPNGKPICTAGYEQSGGLVKVSNNNVFINWADLRNGSVGLRFSVLNPAGAELHSDIEIFWGLSGDAIKDQTLVLPRNNEAVIIWQDSRYAALGYQIFIQVIDENGDLAFEENGMPITLHTGATQLTPAAVILPDGSIVITWEEQREYNPKVYAQMISPSGQRMWGDFGMALTDISPFRQMNPKVTYENGALYFGWSHTVSINGTSYNMVYGQKVVGGQRMWGNDGILISNYNPDASYGECIIYSLVGRYYVWTRTYGPEPYAVLVKKVTETGETADGWNAEGTRVSTYADLDVYQTMPYSYATPDGIITLWNDYRFDFQQNIYGQHLSSSGTYLWDPLGVPMADYGREQEQVQAITSPAGLTFAWSENNIDGITDVYMHRYSFAGQPLWGDYGFAVVERDSAQANPSIARFSNGGMVVAWTDYYGDYNDLYYKYVRENGEMVGDTFGNVLSEADKSQYTPHLTSIGTSAIAIWSDGRTSGKTEILGIFAQRIDNQVNPVDDEENSPTSPISQIRNYPNPFNPETTISFNLKQFRPDVSVNIYNTRGQKVKTLFSGSLPGGNHNLQWKGFDDNNKPVSSGLYFYQISDGTNSQIRKMVLMK